MNNIKLKLVIIVAIFVFATKSSHPLEGHARLVENSIKSKHTFKRVFSSKTPVISNHYLQAKDDHSTHHGMSMLTLIINIIADLSPHGMLPLAYGLAQGGPTGLILLFGNLILKF